MKQRTAITAAALMGSAASLTADDGFDWRSVGWQIHWPETTLVRVPADWTAEQRGAAAAALEGVLRRRVTVNVSRPGQPERIGDHIRVGEAPVRVKFVPSAWPTWHIQIIVAAQGPDTRGRVVFTPGKRARIEIRPQDARRPEDIADVVRHEAIHLTGKVH